MAVHFDNFSPQAFECLVQALCVHTFGPGTIVFGAGPDGAREATFEGEIPFPSTVDRWKGYTVVQAKCREHLRHNSDDAKWLADQLAHDLEKFLDPARSLRAPEFYLLVSNVTLSSVADKGGKAKIEKVFEDYRSIIGIKRYAVWAADELRALLEDAEDIRRAYTAWLTPSDVLANLVERLGRPNLTKLLPLALARDLRNERDVRLKDAGQEPEKAIYLEDVFVDLPIVAEASQHPNLFDEDEVTKHDAASLNVVRKVLIRASDKLEPALIHANRRKGIPLRNRIVILGGPGQGKSTLTQFIMQLERGRLLQAHQPSAINPKVSDLIPPILARAEIEELTFNRPTRFPMRVNLPDFADAIQRTLDQGGTLSLIAFLCDRLVQKIDTRITPSDVRDWLGTCPSLIVLDGLDEVPQTANRRQLIDSIEAFWDDLHLANADTLVIVTTRPQGYNNDLDPIYWEHWELAGLEKPHISKLSQRLSEVRLSNPASRQDVVDAISVAANEEATKSLLTSPLQIAILFGIVLLKGAVPKDRWELFDRYYTLLRDREAQKPHSIVRDYKQQIDLLHKRVGFLLHVEAEKEGKSVSYFSPDQLKQIIKQILTDDEFPETDVERIADLLKTAATDRLVFLAARVADQIAFDVRSLQEFMAAGQITTASPANLVERLREISTGSHWRNVLRIAASKVFSDTDFGYYRDDIVALCHSLDAGDLGDEYRIVRAGGRLALELLTDGISLSAPKYRKSLLRRAFTVIDLCPDVVPAALVDQFSGATRDIFEEQLRDRLRQGTTLAAQGAFKLAFELLKNAREWSEALIIEHWPTDPIKALVLVPLLNLRHCTDRLRSKIRDDQWRAGPIEALRLTQSRQTAILSMNGSEFIETISVLPLAYSAVREHRSRLQRITIVPTAEDGAHGLTSALMPIADGHLYEFRRTPPAGSGWEPLQKVSELARKPTKKSLADALEALGSFDQYRAFVNYFPWILQSAIALKTGTNTFASIAELVLNNAFGGPDDWLRTERRWSKGLTKTDLVASNRKISIGGGIGKLGIPPLTRLQLSHSPLDTKRARDLIEATCEVLDDEPRSRLLNATFFMLHNPTLTEDSVGVKRLLDQIVQEVCDASAPPDTNTLRELLETGWTPLDNEKYLAYLDNLARSNDFQFISLNFTFGKSPAVGMVATFVKNSDLRGLLVFIAKYVLLSKVDLTSIEISHLTGYPNDSDSIRVSLAILQLATDRWAASDIPNLVEQLAPRMSLGLNLKTLYQRIAKHPNGLDLLIAMGAHADGFEPQRHNDYIDALLRQINARPSRLGDSSVRVHLRLPNIAVN